MTFQPLTSYFRFLYSLMRASCMTSPDLQLPPSLLLLWRQLLLSLRGSTTHAHIMMVRIWYDMSVLLSWASYIITLCMQAEPTHLLWIATCSFVHNRSPINTLPTHVPTHTCMLTHTHTHSHMHMHSHVSSLNSEVT